MKSIEKDIREYITSLTDLTYTNIEVVEPYSYKRPDFNKVVIIVQELVNSPLDNTFTNKEEYSTLNYQISILSRTQKLDDVNMSPYEVTGTMYQELVDKLYDRFLLTRVGDPLVRAYGDDDTVLERVFRVGNVIDLEHEYLYRR